MTKCPKCGGYSFKVQETAPSGSNFKLYFIQCSSCDTPVGITEYYNSGAMIEKVQSKLDYLSGLVDSLSSQISQLEYKLNIKH